MLMGRQYLILHGLGQLCSSEGHVYSESGERIAYFLTSSMGYKPFWNVRSHHWEGKDGRLPTKPMTLCCNDIYAKMLLFCLARRLLSLFLGFCWLKRKECIKMDEPRLAALLMSWLQLGRWQEQLGISLDQPSGGCIVAKAFIKVPWLE